jgi:hypothetical protein
MLRRNANPAETANRVRTGQTTLGEGKPWPCRQEGEIHSERKRKPCVEKVNHVEVDHVEGKANHWGGEVSKPCVEKVKHVFCFVEVDHLEGGGKPWMRSQQTTCEREKPSTKSNHVRRWQTTVAESNHAGENKPRDERKNHAMKEQTTR